MAEILHYYDMAREYEIKIIIDGKLFATMFPEDFENINQNHPIIYYAIHYNIFKKY